MEEEKYNDMLSATILAYYYNIETEDVEEDEEDYDINLLDDTHESFEAKDDYFDAMKHGYFAWEGPNAAWIMLLVDNENTPYDENGKNAPYNWVLYTAWYDIDNKLKSAEVDRDWSRNRLAERYGFRLDNTKGVMYNLTGKIDDE